MKRLLMACALASFALACGDDDGDDPVVSVDGGIDGGGGVKDGGSGDSSAPVTIKVTNAGTACTVATAATACTGTAAICQTTTLGNVPIPGGSCSAECTKSEECGPGGTCPTGEAIVEYKDQAKATLGDKGYCAKSCTVGGANTCGTGFICTDLYTLATARGDVSARLPILIKGFCAPAALLGGGGDGGVGDGGIRTVDAGGIDSGR